MSFLYTKEEEQRTGTKATPGTVVTTGEASFIDNLKAAYKYSEYNNTSVSESIVMEEQWDPYIQTINENKQKLGLSNDVVNPGKLLSMAIFNEERKYAGYEKKVNEISKIIKDNPDLFGEFSHEKLIENAKEQARLAFKENQEITERSPSFSNVLARLTGEAGSLIQDPVVIGSLMFGNGPGKLYQLALQQAIVGGGAEYLIQSNVRDWYKKTGLEYTDAQFYQAIAFGAGFGAASPFVFKAGGKTISFTSDQIKKGIQAYKKAGLFKTGSKEDLLVKAAQNSEDAVNSNPLSSESEHLQRLNDAESAIESNDLVNINEVPESSVIKPKNVFESDNLNNEVFKFDPDNLQVDAKLFQFKAGGDAQGVTDALQGVKKWDPIKSGQIVVYEYADGRQFIADGHQRLGLAKRLKAEGQDVTLYGMKIREVDGFTPAYARVTAALKNIAEGTGTAVDAAKVLRVDPSKISELPPRSNLVKQARAVVNLTDELFGMVVNDVVPAKFAAVVGRLIPDDSALQEAAMRVLARNMPDNEFQADAIVRQVIESGVRKETTANLFGEEVMAESFFVERARILDMAQKALRQDKNAFQNLVNNAERLEAEGNQLARNANQERVSRDGQAITLITTLANRKGQLSDALNDAARLARESGNYTNASRGFINSVRSAINQGDFNRLEFGNVRRSFDGEAKVRTSENEPTNSNLNDFDEPAGPGSRQQSNQLEEDQFGELRRQEGFLSDLEARQDLNTKLDQGMTDAEIDNHPAVIRAIEEADAIPKTHEAANYGSKDWFDNREFVVDGMNLKGYAQGVNSLIDRAKKLAYTDAKLEVPPGYKVKTEKKAVILLGPPAAGKSTFANQVARKLNAAIIDSDDAKKILPEFQGGIGAAAVHEESSALAKLVKDLITDEGSNVVIPKVGDTVGSIQKQIDNLKAKGYTVTLANMDVTPQNALTRMLKRFINTGRLVDPVYVRNVGAKPNQTYVSLKQQRKADGYAEVDNNQKLGEIPTIREDTDGIFEGLQFRTSGGERGASGGAVVDDIPGQRIDGPGQEIAEQTSLVDDLDLEIPTELTVDGDSIVAKTQTLKELQEEFAQDQRMLDRLEGCVV